MQNLSARAAQPGKNLWSQYKNNLSSDNYLFVWIGQHMHYEFMLWCATKARSWNERMTYVGSSGACFRQALSYWGIAFIKCSTNVR
jgi:hypothetical protein